MRKPDLLATSLGARIGMCAVCALCILPLAHAEQSSEEPSADAIETIFVTATRRTTDVQSVPIAIDVFGSDQLKESRIQSVEDLQFQTAGLKIAGGALVRISLRGIGPNSITPTSESGVGTFLDGVFLGNGYFQSRAFFDLERVELLRGPQGTLYGRDATVGAFNYVTKAPTSVFEAGGDMTYGNDNLIQTDGYVSGPLMGDMLTGRLAFRTEKHDGYAENLEDNKGLDTADNAEVRGRIAYQPTDALRIDLTADYSRDDGYAALEAFRSNPALPTLYEAVGGLLYGAAPMPGGRKVDQNLIRAGQIRTQGASVKVAWDVDWATLTSITAERGAHQNSPSGDLDFTSAPLLDFTNQFDVEQYTEDLYLVSAGEGRLDWTLGASYFYEKSNTSGLLSVSPFLGGGTLLLDSPELKTEAAAVYGEATYRIFDKLALTGGVRYSWEEKKKSEADDCQSVTCAPPGISAFDVSHSWDEWLPHVSLNYQASDDIMLYASVGRGFKAGGFNALTPQSTPYDPEESTTYEVGLKSELLDRMLVLNVAAFSTDYDDLQVEQRVATPTPHLEVRNAASARVNGVELQLNVRPVEFLSIDGNAAYLDTEYRSFPAAVVDFQPAGPPVTFDASGNQLSQAPEWSANVGAQTTTPLSNLGQLTIRGEYAYQSDVFFTPANTSLFHQAGYNWFNARVSFETNDGRWNVAAWGKNLSDVSRFAYLAPGSPDVPGLSATVFGMMLPPRTYGATVGFKF